MRTKTYVFLFFCVVQKLYSLRISSLKNMLVGVSQGTAIVNYLMTVTTIGTRLHQHCVYKEPW